jgi:LacI family gluconate utilization system Gnt-I transcriptional repressor
MSSKKAPTMSDVAKLAGVSSMTVSRALRSGTSASAKTRAKIQAAADELGYVLDSTAAGLSTRKTGFVAVTIPSINNANFAQTVQGLTEGLREANLQVLLAYTGYSLQEEERMVQGLLQRRPEAIVVTGGVHSDKCRRYLAESGVPVVEMWDMPATPINHVVGFSNKQAGKTMAQFLQQQGFRKIGFIGGNAAIDVRGYDRRRGFLEALDAYGLERHRYWQSDQPVLTMEEGASAMETLLEQYPDTEAVMCASDLSAFGAMMTCVRQGLSVPDDMAICGFGAYDISGNSVPEITTLDVSALSIGTETARIIVAALSKDNKEPISAEVVEIETKLLVRPSTEKISS